MFFRKSITSITKQFASMVSDLQALAETNRTEANLITTNAGELELAANVRRDRELVKVDELLDQAHDLNKEAADADKLAAKIAKTFSI